MSPVADTPFYRHGRTRFNALLGRRCEQQRHRQIEKVRTHEDIENGGPEVENEEEDSSMLSRIHDPSLEYRLQQQGSDQKDLFEKSEVDVKKRRRRGITSAAELVQGPLAIAQTDEECCQPETVNSAVDRDATRSVQNERRPATRLRRHPSIVHPKKSNGSGLFVHSSDESQTVTDNLLTPTTQKTIPVPTVDDHVGSRSHSTPTMSQHGLFRDDDHYTTCISNLPLHASSRGIDMASLTSQAVPNKPNTLCAISFTSRGTKRKRGQCHTIFSAISPCHQRRESRTKFNLFAALLKHPELVLHFASWLSTPTLVNLYSISRGFHIIVNQRFTTVILNQARRKCPGASKIWPWRSYARLCQADPAGINGGVCVKPVPATAQLNWNQQRRQYSCTTTTTTTNNTALLPGRPKIVPTFRWLYLSLHRTSTLHDLLAHFASHAIPLPPGILPTLQKLWFLYDIPDNPRRITYIHTRSLFTDTDLCLALTFVVRLDMMLHDPVAGEKRDDMRKLLMSIREGFDGVLAVLKREKWRSTHDFLQGWVRYGLHLTLTSNGSEQATHDQIASSSQTQAQAPNPNQTVTATATAIATAGSAFTPLQLRADEFSTITSVFHVPMHEIGQLKKEHWGQKTDMFESSNPRRGAGGNAETARVRYLMRIDQLLLRESVRRGLRMRGHIYKSLVWGYIDPVTLETGTRVLRGGRGGGGDGEIRKDRKEGELDVRVENEKREVDSWTEREKDVKESDEMFRSELMRLCEEEMQTEPYSMV